MSAIIAFIMFWLSLLMVFDETIRLGKTIRHNLWFAIIYYGWVGYSVCQISDPFKWVPLVLYVLLSIEVIAWIINKPFIPKILSHLRFCVVCANATLVLYKIFPTL
jgi:hypothetical protein